MMLHRLILKATKFQLPPSKRLSTVVKNIWGGGGGEECKIGLNKKNWMFGYVTSLS